MGDSPSNQDPAYTHLTFFFICNFTEGQSCRQSYKPQYSQRGGWVWRRMVGSGAVPVNPLRFPSAVPTKIHLWQLPEGQNCQLQQIASHCAWQKPFLQPHPTECYMFLDIQGNTIKRARVPFYASLAYAVDFHMRELNGTRSLASQDVLHISKLLNWTVNAFFPRAAAAGSQRATFLMLDSHVC